MVSFLVEACDAKFNLSCKLDFMSYQLTQWNGNTHKWPTLTHYFVSQLQSFFEVRNVNESAYSQLSFRPSFVSNESLDVKLLIFKIADFYDFRFYTLFRRALLPRVLD
jgi:hypothetical protein